LQPQEQPQGEGELLGCGCVGREDEWSERISY